MATSQVPVNLLSLRYSPQRFTFTSTEQLEEQKETPGQERALEALKFGTDIEYSGYNIYALGPPGIGKHQIVRQFLQQKAVSRPAPSEWVYVNNFSDPSKPVAISFQIGQAKIFQQQIQQIIDDLRTTIPSIYESETYRSRRDSLVSEFKDRHEKALSDIQDRAKKENVFLLTAQGAFFFGQGDGSGNILDQEAVSKLPDDEQKQINDRLKRYNDELLSIVSNFPMLERQLRLRIKDLNHEMLSTTVESLVKDVKEKYASDQKISEYIQKMVQDIIENARNFRSTQEEKFDIPDGIPSPLKRYEVNIMVDHTSQVGAPVIYEDNPTFMNLVGQIEHLSQMGALLTDFTLIKPGSLHKANGGYLILDATKLLTAPYAWEGLKRALRSEDIRIESLGQVYSMISTVSLKPEPIPLNCKIILVGNSEIYNLLVKVDPDFSDLFKVSADFETEMVRTPENENKFMKFLAAIIRKNNLLHLDASGAAKLLAYSTRLTSDSERIAISLDPIADLLKESNLFAKQAAKTMVSAEEV